MLIRTVPKRPYGGYEYAEVRVLLARDYAGQEFVIIPKSECEELRAFVEFARTIVERAIRKL